MLEAGEGGSGCGGEGGGMAAGGLFPMGLLRSGLCVKAGEEAGLGLLAREI